MSSLTIEMVDVAAIHRRKDSLKVHTPEQIDHLRASIRRFGFRDPIGVDADYAIIEGHARYQAAVAEGMTELPVIVLTNLTGAERDAYAIAHNRTQLATGMDADAIQREIGRLAVQDDEFFSLGFSDTDVTFLGLNDLQDSEIARTVEASDTSHENDAWTSLVTPVVQTKLRFGDAVKYVQFRQLVGELRSRYPGLRTDAECLTQLATEVKAGHPY